MANHAEQLAPTSERNVRVVVCDDSPFIHRLLQRTFDTAGDVEIVANCTTARQAIAACTGLLPDVVTVDLELPDANGIEVIRAIRDLPTQALVVSSYTSSAANERAVVALAEGAAECMGKPGIGDSPDAFTQALLACIRNLTPAPAGTRGARVVAPAHAPTNVRDRLFVIGASTGGPAAIESLLADVPAGLPCPIVVIQHMPEGFSEPFARRLAMTTGHNVLEAGDGTPLRPGTVLVAPAGRHLRIERGLVRIEDGERIDGSRPSLNLALADAAASWGDRVTAIILTGMGTDGCEGATVVHTAGGRVIAEHEHSCAVYGMPRAVIDAGVADAIVPLELLAPCLVTEAGR